MSIELLSDEQEQQVVEHLRASRRRIDQELSKTIVGQKDVVQQLLISLLAGGHCLITGAPGLAKTLLVFGAAYAASMEAKILTRHAVNNHYGLHSGHAHIPPTAGASTWQKIKHYGTLKHWSTEDKIILAADEGSHLGALYLLNNTLAPFTDRMIKDTSSVIKKNTGWSDEKAHEVSSMLWVWEAANGLGALAGMGVIAGNHTFNMSSKIARLFSPDSHVDRLAKQSALSSSMRAHP